MDKFDQLRAITRDALDEVDGCEWVKSRSIQDIGAYTLEETYELLNALESKNPEAVKDELADLAFHLVLYCEMAAKQGDFSLEDVLSVALEKQQHRRLNREDKPKSAKEAHAYWRSQKHQARQQSEQGLLSDIPANMPALVRSQKIQDRAGDVGFDWDDVNQILIKLNEEIDEFKVEHEKRDQEAMLDELGDIFFTLVNIALHLDIDAEQALRYANSKFIRRFVLVEEEVTKTGQVLESMDFKALLEVWERVKLREKP